jgi:hypothetical protein
LDDTWNKGDLAMDRRPPNLLTVKELETIKALRANGLSYHAIAIKIKRDPKTVKKACLEPQAAKEIQEIKQELADMYEALARRMIDSIADKDIEKINAYQRVLSSCIAVDKMRLLRDQSTENIDMKVVACNINELINQCQEALKDSIPIEGGEIE